MEAFTAGGLLSFLATVADPRRRHGQRHPLSTILAVVRCAIMCGAKSYAAIDQWAQNQDLTLMHRLWKLITSDARFCQREFCQQVIEARGDYLVFVKDNQPTLFHDIELAFAPSAHGAFSPSAARNLG
jgi:hypothetical protein